MKNKFWRNKLLRIPLISIVTGITVTVAGLICAFFIGKSTSEITAGTGIVLSLFETVVALALFIGTGIFCLNDMTKKEIFKSALIVCAYYLIILLLERWLQTGGNYPPELLFLFIPVRVYSQTFELLLHITDIDLLIYMIPCILMPFAYLLFGKKQSHKNEEQSLPTAPVE